MDDIIETLKSLLQYMTTQQLFGSNELLNGTQNFLNAEMTLVRGIIETNKLKNRSHSIKPMIASLLGTGNAISILMNNNQRFYNEGVMLARGFFERITNICYLLLCDENIFNNCTQHTIHRQHAKGCAKEKVAKDENDDIILKISSMLKDSMKDDISLNETIESPEKENTLKKFPIPKIEKRLGYIEKQKILNVSLFLLYQQAYYDDASEALHGSVYGSLFHVLNSKPNKNSNIEKEIIKNATLLVWQTGELINQLIILLDKKNNIGDFYTKSAHNSRTTIDIMKIALKSNI